MAQAKNFGYVPSILDRLLDSDASGNMDRPGYSTAQVVAAIQSDLVYLFNTRRTLSETAKEYKCLGKALGYGLPDFVSLNDLSEGDKKQLARDMEDAIEIYEPRLKNVHVELSKEKGTDPLKVRFRMTAQLAIEPCPEVAFDTMLQLTTGHFQHESVT